MTGGVGRWGSSVDPLPAPGPGRLPDELGRLDFQHFRQPSDDLQAEHGGGRVAAMARGGPD
jgi:hypothetical protein